MLKLKDKKVVVLGMGMSGLAAAEVLARRGARVVVSEEKDNDRFKESLAFLHLRGVKTELGGHREETLNKAELIVTSPGIPLNILPLQRAREKGVPIIGEVELAYRISSGLSFIAVTGTNGKTTTTALIGKILREGGKKAVAAGNIGFPLSQEVLKASPGDIMVVEISSFQLETIEEFKPQVSVILNISPDHLDRHSAIEDYIAAKKRVFSNQKEEDSLVLNADDPIVSQFAREAKAQVFPFSRKKKLKRGVFVEKGRIMSGGKKICLVEEINLPGLHNLENCLAAIAVSLIYNIDLGALRKSLQEFSPLEHRLEYVDEIKGVKFINDSKGTNVEAVLRALETVSGPVVLIAGGRDKARLVNGQAGAGQGSDFFKWRDLLKEKVRALILLGEARGRIKSALSDFKNIEEVKTVEESVRKGYSLAHPGDSVLLSPGCTSFDMFKNFEERGNIFKEAVKQLKRSEAYDQRKD
jgi:UDP-N-acetylmuramoylalanine--D-glutamate ligase